MTSDEQSLDGSDQEIETEHDHLAVATMQRLALLRYLYALGMNQIRQPEPLAALAVLSLHDSVELFLHLCAEPADAQRGHLSKGKMLKFEEYFGIINEAISPERLSHQSAMVRLNEARIGLKHHGTATARLAVEQLGADVSRFFEDNTPVVFHTEFGNISMANLVASHSAKTFLKNAEAELARGNTEAASEFIAVAFQHLIREYEHDAAQRFGQSPYAFGESFTFDSSFMRNPTLLPTEQHRFEDKLVGSVTALQEAMKIIGLGIDYRRYTKFRLLTPAIMMFSRDNYSAQVHRQPWPPSPEACRFCFDFVVETAFRLHDFDMDLT